ncbi:hypothetical protein JHK86_055565 [Glycine max]|nr:hypothetical protein JHK86_055565 [Glycine max]
MWVPRKATTLSTPPRLDPPLIRTVARSFVDGGSRSKDIVIIGRKQSSMLFQEVGVVVSILPGFAPPSTFFVASSSKDNPMFNNSFWSTNSDKVGIQLLDENDVSVVSLDEHLEDWTNKEISGSYSPNALEPLNGVLTIPLANGALMNLHICQRKFILGLMSLTCNVQRAIQIHDDLSPSAKGPAKLLTTCFDGIKGSRTLGKAWNKSGNGVSFPLDQLLKMDEE